MFVPLAHPPGHAQSDFGEAVVIIGALSRRRISSSRTCCTVMPALCVLIPRRQQRSGLTATSTPSRSSAKCLRRSYTTTTAAWLRRSCRMERANERHCSAGSWHITCSVITMAVPAKVTTKATRRAWLATPAASTRQMFCAASPRPSVNASRGIRRRFPAFRQRRSMPAIRPPDGSAPRYYRAILPDGAIGWSGDK